MKHSYQVVSIEASAFAHLFESTDAELTVQGARRMTVDRKPGYPCRVSLEDANIGEEVILFSYEHHRVNSPYQAKGPVFIRKNAKTTRLPVNELPAMLTHRLLSLRAYDGSALMQKACTIQGSELPEMIENILEDPEVRYIQVHNAGPGCYNCQINRI